MTVFVGHYHCVYYGTAQFYFSTFLLGLWLRVQTLASVRDKCPPLLCHPLFREDHQRQTADVASRLENAAQAASWEGSDSVVLWWGRGKGSVERKYFLKIFTRQKELGL